MTATPAIYVIQYTLIQYTSTPLAQKLLNCSDLFAQLSPDVLVVFRRFQTKRPRNRDKHRASEKSCLVRNPVPILKDMLRYSIVRPS